jgi:hypothetical protein
MSLCQTIPLRSRYAARGHFAAATSGGLQVRQAAVMQDPFSRCGLVMKDLLTPRSKSRDN